MTGRSSRAAAVARIRRVGDEAHVHRLGHVIEVISGGVAQDTFGVGVHGNEVVAVGGEYDGRLRAALAGSWEKPTTAMVRTSSMTRRMGSASGCHSPSWTSASAPADRSRCLPCARGRQVRGREGLHPGIRALRAAHGGCGPCRAWSVAYPPSWASECATRDGKTTTTRSSSETSATSSSSSPWTPGLRMGRGALLLASTETECPPGPSELDEQAGGLV